MGPAPAELLLSNSQGRRRPWSHSSITFVTLSTIINPSGAATANNMNESPAAGPFAIPVRTSPPITAAKTHAASISRSSPARVNCHNPRGGSLPDEVGGVELTGAPGIR